MKNKPILLGGQWAYLLVPVAGEPLIIQGSQPVQMLALYSTTLSHHLVTPNTNTLAFANGLPPGFYKWKGSISEEQTEAGIERAFHGGDIKKLTPAETIRVAQSLERVRRIPVPGAEYAIRRHKYQKKVLVN